MSRTDFLVCSGTAEKASHLGVDTVGKSKIFDIWMRFAEIVGTPHACEHVRPPTLSTHIQDMLLGIPKHFASDSFVNMLRGHAS